MQDQGPTVSFCDSCPSFNSYSSDRLSAIADRVSEEERNKQLLNRNGFDERNHNDNGSTDDEDDDDDDDDDFEFVLVRTNPNDCTAICGDEMMASYPVFPLFNRDLLLDYEDDNQSKDQVDEMASAIRLPLGKLFIEDRDPPSSSSSSSEVDKLERISPGTYCVWTPAKSPSASPSPSTCKKSNSTGSSSKQKWRLRDLLHLRRCSSDGKESFIFFHPDNNNNNNNNNNIEKKKEGKGTEKDIKKAGKAKEKVSAHEVFYVRNKALKEGDKRRSYLPYRQGLVGFFANVNGFGRTFPPF